MAEVFRARASGIGGFEKTLVVKKLFPHLLLLEPFAQMFIEEAKLAARIRHRNIVQIYDLDRAPTGELYIAMELIAGVDLRVLLRCAKERRAQLPVWFAVHVASEVASALSYAHSLRGDRGEPLNVVHRDVTPANIFVSEVGDVKLGDFGIAKSTASRSVTRADEIKGKIAYMAPEQILRGRIDHRADLFALGVVLWELLTQERLFTRPTEIEIMTAICRGDRVPPSALSSAVPPELDAIVLALLEQHPDRRIQSALELERRLSQICSTLRPGLIPEDMRDVIADCIGRSEQIGQLSLRPSLDTGPDPSVTRSEPSRTSRARVPQPDTIDRVQDPGELAGDLAEGIDIPIDEPDFAPYGPTRATVPAGARLSDTIDEAEPLMIDGTTIPIFEGAPAGVNQQSFFLRDAFGAVRGPLTDVTLFEEARRMAGSPDLSVSTDRVDWVSLAEFARLSGQDHLASAPPHGVPLFTGDLRQRGLIATLLALWGRSASGSLTLYTDEGPSRMRREVHFVDGALTYVSAGSPDRSVPAMLVRRGVLLREELPLVLRDVILSRHAIETVAQKLSQEDVWCHWCALMRERLAEISEWRSATYSFDGSIPAWRRRSFAQNPVCLIVELVDRARPDGVLRRSLAGELDTHLIPSLRLPHAIDQLGLSASQRKLITQLSTGRTLRGLLPPSPQAQRPLLVAVAALLEAGLILRAPAAAR